MTYYDKLASKWHKITGYKGGAFKELILNELVISKINRIESKSILEIGAGNGYFMPMLLKKKSGQRPQKLMITDISTKQLETAKKIFKISYAEYRMLDVYKKFSIENNSVDIIISNMVFNELKGVGLKNGLKECERILKIGGRIIISVLHPEFVEIQIKRGVVKNNLMISTEGFRVPVVQRSLQEYKSSLESADINYTLDNAYGNQALYNIKPKLKELKGIPIALIIIGTISK
ncbi:MAG: class I SAM-dependent methyltransferase [Ignavibacteria bacterium]|nr:class I SAM-dependent methyltransferase [Ignavibacteria bacterium]MBT8381827.1 class I SAM-dependent methyltransferase [Ignavibacteria bacterium]MBT8390878.1 class I SAM-dependent methyltransferase [Ignavibacteria bacterium]NNL22082.1 class I SAM-dependent methyltransferase [Ignavibacteriaceae bacterium]